MPTDAVFETDFRALVASLSDALSPYEREMTLSASRVREQICDHKLVLEPDQYEAMMSVVRRASLAEADYRAIPPKH